MTNEPFQADEIVKTCCKLESGLNLAVNGLRACTRGALMPPLFCSAKEIQQGLVDLDFIVAKRKNYIKMLNDDHSDMDCKRCLMVEEKRYGDISFSGLGHIDLQHYTYCNLRCSYCLYTQNDLHLPPQYDALGVLRLFGEDSIEWNAYVDFAGGEPSLLPNLEEYLAHFREARIRVLMYTNALWFHQAIYDGLRDGSIYLVTTSLDAGTPSTYSTLRGSDGYLRVLENLCRYAAAGSRGMGMLVVKYIFCETNCSDDDVAGFAYAMLALRPQKVWLTFDFSPLYLQHSTRVLDKQIDAYAKLYLLLQQHGLEAFHYFAEAIGTFSQEGREIMSAVLKRIEYRQGLRPTRVPDLLFRDFRNPQPPATLELATFTLGPLRFHTVSGEATDWSPQGKRLLLIPATPATVRLLSDPQLQTASWIGFVDRNPLKEGKTLEGHTIHAYEAIDSLQVDMILLVPPEKHRSDIVGAVSHMVLKGVLIAELRP